MASVGDFKHIAVNRAEEDEVIIAGAVERTQAPEAPAVQAASSRQEPAKPQGRPSDGPTLEDLRTGPAPMAQKVVIIAAVALIIVALVYYFAFMG